MKKLQVFALAALVAFGFSSCIKETESKVDVKGNHQLVIKLAGATRAVTAPGSAAAATLSDGMIYVFASGELITSEAITSSISTGQTLATLVPADATVFVVGNTAANGITLPTTPTSAASIMSAELGSVANLLPDTTQVPLATVNEGTKTFAAQTITIVDAPTTSAAGTATCSINLLPVVARIELVAVEDHLDSDTDPDVYAMTPAVNTSGEDFSVTGVSLFAYNNQYTLGGKKGAGANVAAPVYTGTGLYDTGSWAGVDGVAKAAADGSKVWAYNVPAETKPLFGVRVEGGSDPDADGDPYVAYLKVKNYTLPDGKTTFEPGNIYRIAKVPFDSTQFATLPDEPDPFTDYELTVDVTVVPWTVIEISDVEM